MLTVRMTRVIAAVVALAVITAVGLVAAAASATLPDTTPPTLLTIGVDKSAVNVTSSPDTVTVTMTAADDVAVDQISVELDSPDGSQYRYGTTDTPASGGTWQVPITIPIGLAHGTWSVVWVSVRDTSSNYSDYGVYGNAPLPTPTTVQVTDTNEDVEAPQVGSATMPNTVDVGSGAQDVTVSVPLTDDKSGVDNVEMTVLDKDGNYAPLDWVAYPDVTGSPNAETLTGTFTVPHVALNGLWSVRVSASDAAGNSVTTTPSGGTFTVQNGAATAPEAPTYADVSRGGPGELEVYWPASYNNGSTITAYNLMQSTDGGGNWTAVTPSAGTSTDVVVPGLDSTKSYVFRVSATNSVGTSGFSPMTDPLSPIPASATTPSAPADVTATAGNGSATVSWGAPASNGGTPVTGYRVDISSNGGTSWSIAATGLAGSPYTAVGLTNGTSYRFRVSALNAVGYSPAAMSAVVTPQAPVTTPPAPVVTPNPAAAANPSIAGTAKVGKVVSATVTLPSGVTVTYKWVLTVKKRGKKKVKTVGNGATLKLKSAWKKGKLQLVVTFAAPGQPSSIRTILVSAKLK